MLMGLIGETTEIKQVPNENEQRFVLQVEFCLRASSFLMAAFSNELSIVPMGLSSRQRIEQKAIQMESKCQKKAGMLSSRLLCHAAGKFCHALHFVTIVM